jgi:GTP-binding protein HflX
MKKALLAALKYPVIKYDFNVSIEEIKQLAIACDLEIEEILIQEDMPHKATYVGKGKLAEIVKKSQFYDVVIFNEELTPLQMRNISDLMTCEVLDRTDLILKIFESRAHTKEAILQVKMARLQYELPRLSGAHGEIYSQQGGSGFRGAGEQMIELEKRRIRKELTSAKKELAQLKKTRMTQRRHRQGMKTVALVGYTNSGKSTLLNHFTHKKVMAKDMLFATLETATRKALLKNGREVLMIDTVGFISQLPHFLIEAFKSTLEEVSEADLIVFVIDSSSHYLNDQIEVTTKVLKELGVADIPVLYVYNKSDLLHDVIIPREPYVFISLKEDKDLDRLEDEMIRLLFNNEERYHFLIPYSEGVLYKTIRNNTTFIKETFEEDGIHLVVEAPLYYEEKYKDYLLSSS